MNKKVMAVQLTADQQLSIRNMTGTYAQAIDQAKNKIMQLDIFAAAITELEQSGAKFVDIKDKLATVAEQLNQLEIMFKLVITKSTSLASDQKKSFLEEYRRLADKISSFGQDYITFQDSQTELFQQFSGMNSYMEMTINFAFNPAREQLEDLNQIESQIADPLKQKQALEGMISSLETDMRDFTAAMSNVNDSLIGFRDTLKKTLAKMTDISGEAQVFKSNVFVKGVHSQEKELQTIAEFVGEHNQQLNALAQELQSVLNEIDAVLTSLAEYTNSRYFQQAIETIKLTVSPLVVYLEALTEKPLSNNP